MNILEKISSFENKKLSVGLLDSENAQIGFYNVFGTKNIPERNFFDLYAEERDNIIKKFLINLTIDQAKSPDLNVDLKLEELGIILKNLFRQSIIDFKIPENAPSTQRKKGRDDPLVDIGIMRDSINYEVTTE